MTWIIDSFRMIASQFQRFIPGSGPMVDGGSTYQAQVPGGAFVDGR